MRVLVVTCITLLIGTAARAELYAQKKSVSPDGNVVFAINYPPTEEQPERAAQGCFLHRKSNKPIGGFFSLPDTDAETDHPGTYTFDNYNVLEYVWSTDSTHVAVTLNRRRWSEIYAFRLRGSAFQMLNIPNLRPLLETHLKNVIQLGQNTGTHAERWTKHHRLIASITKEAQVTHSGDSDKDWKLHTSKATIVFARDGTPTIEATKFRVHDEATCLR